MGQATERENHADNLPVCSRCGRTVSRGRSFAFQIKPSSASSDSPNAHPHVNKCIRCAVLHGPMLKRSLAVALVIGTALTLLNQGDKIFAADWTTGLYWKIPVTFCVPFCVATYGALTSSRR